MQTTRTDSIADPTLDFADIGPDGLAGQFLRRFWQPVYVSRKLRTKRAAPLRILGEDFTIYRGEDGAPHVVAAYCPHRNTRLSVGLVEGDAIRCFYHGWKFDHLGACIDQPAERNSPSSKMDIAAYPTREYIGLIFAYFGPGDPPDFPKFDIYEGDGYVETDESFRRWSFFDQLENSVDEVHFNFVHRRSKFTDVGLNDEIPELSAEETEYGILRIGKRSNRIRHSHILMPNCMYSMIFEHFRGWAEHLAWRVPVDANSHVSFMVDCVHKQGAELDEYKQTVARHAEELSRLEPTDSIIEKCLSGEMHVDDLDWRADLVLLQDAVAMGALRTPRDRALDHLTTSDRQVVMLRRLWRRELTALAAGGPLKAWTIPLSLVPTSGTP